MKKLLLLFLFPCLFSIGCCSVSESKKNLAFRPKVSLTTTQEVYNLSNGEITYTIKNNTDESVFYGAPVLLEVSEGEAWQLLSANTAWTLQLMTILPGETVEKSFDLRYWANNFAPGTYRIVEEILKEAEDGSYVGENYTVTFSLK